MHSFIKYASFLAALAVAGCANTLESVGVPTKTATNMQTVSTDVLDAGTLGCKYSGIIAAVVGVTVTGHAATDVANACAAITVGDQLIAGAVPSPLPVGSVPIAVVPPSVANAVAASKGS